MEPSWYFAAKYVAKIRGRKKNADWKRIDTIAFCPGSDGTWKHATGTVAGLDCAEEPRVHGVPL
jgi:hypothetical protein